MKVFSDGSAMCGEFRITGLRRESMSGNMEVGRGRGGLIL